MVDRKILVPFSAETEFFFFAPPKPFRKKKESGTGDHFDEVQRLDYALQ
jgi:hypothetical protein